jgi:uncharacterized cupredoxin-like copper-binding protein
MFENQNRPLNRRRFIQTSAIAGSGLAITFLARATVAQDSPATPGASPAASPSASPAASPVSNTAFTVDMTEFAFTPNELTVPANTDVTITLVNKGVVSHDFVIGDPSFSSPLVDPGKTGTVTVNLPAGKYEFTCTIEGHADAGMYGDITAK